ncbi:MAG: radical SAM protein [Nitrospirae bacterium]|nr:radical SAM protein [Nitrospirota bacterium]
MGKMIQAIADKALLQKIPWGVQFDLTMRCNELCVHCYRVEESRPELTTEEVYAVLDQLAAAGTLYLTFSGGEVLLRRDFFAIVERARRLRFDVRVKTNALLVTEEIARRMVELGVSQVDISVYSLDPERHDGVTLNPGSLRRTLEGATLLQNAGMRVRLNCPLMQQTVEGYQALLEWGEARGFKVSFDPTITAKSNGDPAPLQLRISRDQPCHVLRHPYFHSAIFPSEAPPTPAAPDPADEIPCGASHSSCYVSPYGDVYPCVSMPIPCGNIRQRPFLEIWQRSEEMLRVRSIFRKDLPHCRTCAVADHCSRCPGMAYVEHGLLTGPSAAACQQACVKALLSDTFVKMEVHDAATASLIRQSPA